MDAPTSIDLTGPELLADAIAGLVAYALSNLAKRIGDVNGGRYRRAIRRAIPVVVVVVAAAARAGLEAAIYGGNVGEALIRGAAAGAFTLYGHEFQRRTVAGDVRGNRAAELRQALEEIRAEDQAAERRDVG